MHRARTRAHTHTHTHTHMPGDNTDKYLLFCSIYKFLPLSCEGSFLNALPCHPSCPPPTTFVPHLLSSNMNPGETAQCVLGPNLVTILLVIPAHSYTHTHTLTHFSPVQARMPPLPFTYSKSSSHICMHAQTLRPRSEPRAQPGLPGGQAFVGTEGPRGGRRPGRTRGRALTNPSP